MHGQTRFKFLKKYFKFKTESNAALSPAYSAAQPKQYLRMTQMSPKSDRHSVGTYLLRCATVRLPGIVRIYVLESNT